MEDLRVQVVNNGFIIRVECSTFVTQSIEQAMEHISLYLRDRNAEVKKLEKLGWLKSVGTATEVSAAIPCPDMESAGGR